MPPSIEDRAADRLRRARLSRHPSQPYAAVLAIEPPAWTVDALCAQVDAELFFPEKGESNREAKRVCGGCPVRAECLGWALANNERYGIYGGLSDRERLRLVRTGAMPSADPHPCLLAGCGHVSPSESGLARHARLKHAEAG